MYIFRYVQNKILDKNWIRDVAEQLTISITDFSSYKISTTIYHTAVYVWCNVAYLFSWFSFWTLTDWKRSNKWHTLALPSWSWNWKTRPIIITQTWKTSKSKRSGFINTCKAFPWLTLSKKYVFSKMLWSTIFRDHAFSIYANFSQKLAFLIRSYECACQEIWHTNFSEKFAYVLNKWMIPYENKLTLATSQQLPINNNRNLSKLYKLLLMCRWLILYYMISFLLTLFKVFMETQDENIQMREL